MPRLRVTGFRVLIRPDPIEKVTKGGIVIPVVGTTERRAQAAQMTGAVIDVGSTAWKAFDPGPHWKPWAKVGDHVVYSRHAGRFIADPDNPGQELILLNDEDVLAVIEEKEEEQEEEQEEQEEPQEEKEDKPCKKNLEKKKPIKRTN